MPEFTAPGLGKKSNTVTVDLEVGENASGVLYALGGASGGLTLYTDKGDLIYEYNMMIIERYTARSGDKIAPGKRRIEVDTTIARPGTPAEVVIKVDGKEAARTTVKRTVPAAFTASETFDVGVDLGSPVSLDYFDRRPFAFTGEIKKVLPETWSLAKIRAAIDTEKTQTVTLPAPVPVLLYYWTAQGQADGSMHFKNDVYRRDPAVLKALDSEFTFRKQPVTKDLGY
jgi:hypothetical protein